MLKAVRTTAKLSVPKPVIFRIDTSIHIERSVVVIVAAAESIQFDDKLSELHVQHDKSKNDLSCNAKQVRRMYRYSCSGKKRWKHTCYRNPCSAIV
ncbi:hypothetical protein T09_8579 [Trichinella sp. T9]|nr:hypothetical protein T09_8579 [Trichinella sp. T9]